ncbi:MAG: NTP transferase domain-containing protein [Candidatus Aenigmarchaeota archaeon]|nr:NTP transferase domain-containing protein [Candidatus Aenigmarchaeota archaeon]
MKCIVLAAGRGTRMLPLTADKPKHMILVDGRPFVDYIIESLQKAGITEIAFVVSYRKDVLESYLSEKYPDVVTIDQRGAKGTGHAVLAAQEFVGNEPFVALMGDNLYSPRDIKTVAYAKQNVVAGFEVDNPSLYGVLVVAGTRLDSIVEKPKDPPSRMINTGLYKFTPEIFDELVRIKLSPRGEYELTDAINALAAQGKCGFYKLKDYWIDFGKPEDVKKVEKFLRKLKNG